MNLALADVRSRRPRDDDERRTECRYTLKRIALELNKPKGEWGPLAEKIGRHVNVISRWYSEGVVPMHSARWMQKTLGFDENLIRVLAWESSRA